MKKQSNHKNHKNHKLGSTIVAITLAMSTMSSVYAEPTGEKDYELEPVVVTATKTPLKISEANANVYVITREQIERNHYHDLSQALKTVPGVDMVNFGDVGYESSNNIRINGTDQIVVLIDGIRANVADLFFPVNAYINMDQIERIEVIKGSTSVLYGSAAKGGVINIITRNPEDFQTKVTVTGGSFDKENYNLFHTGKSEDTTWMFSLQKDFLRNMKNGNGDTVPQHLNAVAATFKISQKFGDTANLTFVYDKYISDISYSGSRFFSGAMRTGDRNTDSFRAIWDKKISDTAENKMSLMITNYDLSYEDSYYVSSPTKVQTTVFQEQLTKYAGKNHRLVFGFDYSNDDIQQRSSIVKGSRNLSEYALYAQDEWNLAEKWKLTTGLRLTKHSEFGLHTGPNINLGYKPTEKTNYYVAYNSHYISPSVVTLFGELELMPGLPLLLPNPDLKPESGETIEFGINHNLNETTSAAFHVYKRKSKNVIESSILGYVDVGDGYAGYLDRATRAV